MHIFFFVEINNCAQCKCAEANHHRWKINFPRVFAIIQRWSVIFDGILMRVVAFNAVERIMRTSKPDVINSFD